MMDASTQTKDPDSMLTEIKLPIFKEENATKKRKRGNSHNVVTYPTYYNKLSSSSSNSSLFENRASSKNT